MKHNLRQWHLQSATTRHEHPEIADFCHMYHNSKAKRWGRAAGIVAFVLIMALSLVNQEFKQWVEATDLAIFGENHPRFHPTLAICAAVGALAAGLVGYLLGSILDRRHH